MTEPLSKEETKKVFKQAMKEWADEKYNAVGRWTVNSLLIVLVIAVAWFVLEINGWTPPFGHAINQKIIRP